MANADNTLNPSAQPAPEIDRGRPSQPPTGRRRMLGLAAGATALATTALAAAAIEDEPLVELWGEYQRLNRLFHEAADAAASASDIAAAKFPPRPPPQAHPAISGHCG